MEYWRSCGGYGNLGTMSKSSCGNHLRVAWEECHLHRPLAFQKGRASDLAQADQRSNSAQAKGVRPHSHSLEQCLGQALRTCKVYDGPGTEVFVQGLSLA